MNTSQQDFALLNMSCPRNVMRFCLVYRGPLSATQGKKGKKKRDRALIRSQIQPQMQRLWETHEALIMLEDEKAWVPGPRLKQGQFYITPDSPFQETWKARGQDGFVNLAGPIEVKGKKFKPLVRKSLDLTCSLKVLFLRQEPPGSLLKKAGDIDNRIKTLIDALEMPSEELDGDESDMNYPLLENDTLVRGLEIDTERLLLPDEEHPNQVHLVVEVTLTVERVADWNLCLL